MNTENVKIIKKNLAVWKLSTAIAILKSKNSIVPKLAASLLLNDKKEDISDSRIVLLESAFTNCLNGELNTDKKLIERIGYLKYEIFKLLEANNQEKLSRSSVADLIGYLQIYPITETDFVYLEIKLLLAISMLTDGSLIIAEKAIKNNLLRIKKNRVSNKIFLLIKLARRQSVVHIEDKQIILELIRNQDLLLKQLSRYTYKELDNKSIKETLKVVHWQPCDMETAKDLYNKSVRLLKGQYIYYSDLTE
jgi:hypothetical protein